MIIALSADEAVVNTTRKLKTLYHPEKAFLMSEIAPPNEDLSQCSEIPIKRITILGHSEKQLFEGISAEKFAKQIIAILKSNEQKYPGFINNLEAIDLLGCEIGLNNPNLKGFGIQFAHHLSAAGIKIKINGFTSELYESDTNYTDSLLRHKEGSWSYAVFTSTQDGKKYVKTTEKIPELLIKRTNIEAILYDLIKEEDTLQIQNKTLTETIHSFKANVTKKRLTIAPKDIEPFERAVKEGEKKLKKMYDAILQNNIKISDLRKEQHLKSNDIETLDHLINESNHFLQKYEIARTDNPRTFFDTHSQCNFMNAVPPHISEKSQLFRKQILRQKAEEDPLYQPTINHKSRH